MRVYADPINGKESSIGEQIVTAYFERKAVEEAAPEQYFTQLASVKMMPKNSGKTIERYVHIPLLDDRNINDQGINALGKKIEDGNLYGSSRDVGTVTRKMPVIDENGQRVNRVGFKRRKIKGTMQNFGYFTEYSRDSLDFDTENDLEQYVHSQMISTASQITEDLLQIDLLNAAGTIFYGGTAQSDAEMTETSKVSYEDLARLSVALDNTRTPKNTTVITGSVKVDTKTLPAARVMFIGPDLIQQLRKMVDYHGDAAFIPVQKYGDATTILRGEIGTVDQFRIVVNPEMMKWEGAGATVSDDKGIYTTEGKADIYPMLVVGDDAFTTIGFHPTGTNTKFEIIHVKPGSGNASNADPYGKRGFMSIQWWYGFMVHRPERIALAKTVVEL
ncbi:MAG: N4-gp56 family major capsid protein [Caryophanon sp.]|nr:N4-gp56 family major capsid protein [Caryophanon sp.]